ncbi:MAG TPA: hypothetical protein VFR34_09165 [Paracoccaceae bacterium]|nr:hypothetical protein [Paracoccaceae bacterium]
MTALAPASPLAPAVLPDRHFRDAALFMLALLSLTAAAHSFDPRLLDGVNVWAKPAKFALSFVVYFATLAFFARRLSHPFRRGWAMAITVPVALGAAPFEMAYIIAQAGQQAHSHFNTADPFHALMYNLMGVGAVALTAVPAVLGLLIARDPGARLSPGLRNGAVLGLIGGALLTLVTAGYLSQNGGHFVGTPAPGAPVLPLFGWSLSVGDLRPAHFLALHAMQALPLAGWLLDRHAAARAVPAVTLAALLWACLTAALFARALLGLPFLPLLPA